MRLLQKRLHDWAHYPAVNHPDESCLGDKSEAANSTDYQSVLHHADVAAVDGGRRRAHRLRRFPPGLASSNEGQDGAAVTRAVKVGVGPRGKVARDRS